MAGDAPPLPSSTTGEMTTAEGWFPRDVVSRRTPIRHQNRFLRPIRRIRSIRCPTIFLFDDPLSDEPLAAEPPPASAALAAGVSAA